MKDMSRRWLLIICLAGIVFAQGIHAQWNNPQALKLAQVMDKVSRFYVDSIDDSEVVENTITEMLHELDPHSSYLSKEQLEELNEQLEGEFEGIGVSFNILEDTIYIIRAISGGPSEKVGIMAGDRIIRVEGEAVAGTGITTTQVQKLLKGPKGTIVDISVQRRGVSGLIEFSITRDKIPVFSLDASYMVSDRIGYVKLARFSHTTIDEFEKAVYELNQQGMEDLILDLSGNGGGWLPVAVELADHFLTGNKEIVRTEGRNVSERTYRARKDGMFEKGNLVIMIDHNSASASEIVSGAVQDWDRGVIVGRRSFGKGLVQQPFYLTDGSMIRLTVARYYTPTGRLIQKSYDEGFEEYSMDLINRYNSGELVSSDSIVFPESQKYRTLLKNSVVYGGGGIMPDYFVPIDTTSFSDYYRQLINRGLFNRYMLQYVDHHRDEFLDRYGAFDKFNRDYTTSQEQMEGLIAFASSEGLEFREDDWNNSIGEIRLLFKAYLARDLYGMGYFYQVFNTSDEVFQKAVEILENPSLHHQKLAKVDL